MLCHSELVSESAQSRQMLKVYFSKLFPNAFFEVRPSAGVHITNILMTAFCAAVLQFVSCSNQVKNVKSALISADEAKEIVAKEFEESDYHQQYYVVMSDKFDDRVYEISWGEPVLVRVIPDGKLYSEESYYYLLTGILPTGQVLATQTVDAVTGKMLTGSLLKGLDQSGRNILLTFNNCIVLLYRQWVADGRKIPMEEMIELATTLLENGMKGFRNK